MPVTIPDGMVQTRDEPVFGRADQMVHNFLSPLYRSTVTKSSTDMPVDFQVILTAEFLLHDSPPLGDTTVNDGEDFTGVTTGVGVGVGVGVRVGVGVGVAVATTTVDLKGAGVAVMVKFPSLVSL